MMKRSIPTLSLTVLSLMLMTAHPVNAQDKSSKEETKVSKEEAKKLIEENRKKVEAEIKKETPITEWISSENALLKRLPKKNQQTFFIIRNKHSVIRAVETVRRDVGNAVEACSKNNRDMAKPMKKRFKEWTNSIDPIIKDAKGFLEIELKEQEAFHVTDYKHITKLNDKAYSFSEKQIKKTPVTTKEACQGLIASMDRTEDNLINILQDTLLPEEVVRERAEQADKAKKKAEELAKKRKAEQEAKEKAKK